MASPTLPKNVMEMKQAIETILLEECLLSPLSRYELLDALNNVARQIIEHDSTFSGDLSLHIRKTIQYTYED